MQIDDRRYRCYACGAHGDVIDLARALHGLSWRDALAHVGRVAGIDLGTLRRIDRAAIGRRATVNRRRQALRRWREHELTRCADEIRQLTGRAQVLARDRAGALRAGDVAPWAALDGIYSGRDIAELRLLELSDDDERAWLTAYQHGGGEDDRDSADLG